MSAWRYRCPHGHASWKVHSTTGNDGDETYFCETCRQAGRDGRFDDLRDMKQEASA